MFRPISTFLHGVIDYLSAATFATLPRSLGWGDRATRVMDTLGGTTLASSLMTDYELGAVKLLPMECHLKADAAVGGVLLASAVLLDEEEDGARATMAGLGVFCLLASMMTRAHPNRGRTETRATQRIVGGDWEARVSDFPHKPGQAQRRSVIPAM
jgi:hypothetical protein